MFHNLKLLFLDFVEVVVFAVAIFLFVYLLVLQPHKIKGDSMQPNFPNGEYILTDKISYRIGEPKRGDVIVFEAPGTGGEEFIKRIIGLPGETVELDSGKLKINGKTLVENYLPETIKTQAGPFLTDGKVVVVPEANYFVLGDNREASSDSRIWGFVTKGKISGRAWIVYWPLTSSGFIEKTQYSFN